MCGLTGFLSDSSIKFNNFSNQLKPMVDSISHRGPDDDGFWIDEKSRVAIGHRRLSVQDLSFAGHQPMCSSSGRYIIAFNGEIYNHLNLRERLDIESDDSKKWVGHSDTETLLSCFEAWGLEATLKEISGMFAIALYDTKHNAFYLIRDRMGEKPLYYGWSGNVFLFGSELKSIKPFQGFSPYCNENSLELIVSSKSKKPCSKHGKFCKYNEKCINYITSKEIIKAYQKLIFKK